MYCPQCGQQQASNEMRFCSRCGFPLGGVVELLARGGVFGSNTEGVEEQGHSPRRNGVRQGVMLMLIGTVVVPILAIINSFQHQTTLLDILVPLSAVIFFAGGLMRILYAVLFEKGASASKPSSQEYAPPAQPAPLNASTRVSALPPAQSIPAQDFAPRRMNTAELVTPPSVTENTTRLLDEEKATRNE
ncbi:MAG TPA: zinc ribbon domain-containing protein [Pyrinomonadaceae bacterium]|nr:zinc ribbon domain-containing protein [Pyrinomonadaceae bacterium]